MRDVGQRLQNNLCYPEQKLKHVFIMVYVLLVHCTLLSALAICIILDLFSLSSLHITMASKTHKRTLPIWVYAKKDANGELIMPPSCNFCSTSHWKIQCFEFLVPRWNYVSRRVSAPKLRIHIERLEGNEYRNHENDSGGPRTLSLLDSTRYKQTYAIGCPAAKVMCSKTCRKLMFKAMKLVKPL